MRFGVRLHRTLTHALERQGHRLGVLPVELELPHLREDVRDFRRLDGLIPRHEQALVMEEHPLVVRLTQQFDPHRAIA